MMGHYRRTRIKNEILFVPSIFMDESPEEREIVTRQHIEEFCERIEENSQHNKANNNSELGFAPKAKKDPKQNTKHSAHGKYGNFMEEEVKKTDPVHKTTLSASFKTFPPSIFEQEEQEAMQIKLKFEKNKLQERTNLIVETFDNALEELRCRKFQLEINIKRAEQKLLTLYEEFRILQNLQPKEESIESRYNGKLSEISDLNIKILEHEKLLERKKDDVNTLIDNKKKLMAEFESFMEDGVSYRDALLKIYLRKIKIPNIGEDGEEEDSDNDMDDDDSDGDDYEEDEVVETCPPGCEVELYKNVCKLRERRIALEALMTENSKQLEALVREKESKLKKNKVLASALLSIEKEMQEFQKEKQNALNQINVAIILYMHQIEYLIGGELPDDLSAALVFSNTTLEQLKETIKDHGAETLALRKLQKELRKQFTMLVRDRKAMEARTMDLEQRVVDVQVLKFGQVINLDVLDKIRVKKDTEEVKLQLKKQEMQYAKELSEWNQVIDNAIDDLAGATRESSSILNVIADLKEKLQALEQRMKESMARPLRDVFIEKRKSAAEEQHLCKVVEVQQAKIAMLLAEIKAIKNNRSGHYP